MFLFHVDLIFRTHEDNVLKPNRTEQLSRELHFRQQSPPLGIGRSLMFMLFEKTKGSCRADVYFSGLGSRVTIIIK